MNIVLSLTGILIFGFIINVILKQSYNFLFFLGRKPLAWIGSVVVIALIVWGVSAIAGWGVSIPAWACALALFLNLPPSQNTAEEKETVKMMADEVYAEMGIKHGRLLHRAGLAVFAFTCLGSWVIFYGEVCTGKECTRIIQNIF
jgi:hypothetical protein